MNILELFYKEIIKEAAIGRINGSDFPYNILFETDIPSLKIKTSSRIEDENVLVYAKLQDKYGRITYISSNGVAIN